MKANRKLNLALAISSLSLSALSTHVQAQSTLDNELDITISVIEEGETPSGFINRLSLPNFDSFNSAALPSQQTQDNDIQVEIDAVSTLADDTGLILTERVVEAISIDGTTAIGDSLDVEVDAGSVIAVPDDIVDILNPDIPLQDSLQDTLDIVDSLSEPSTGSGSVNNLSDTMPEVDTIVEIFEPGIEQTGDVSAQELLNQLDLSPPEDLLDSPPNNAPELDTLDGIADEISELPIR